MCRRPGLKTRPAARHRAGFAQQTRRSEGFTLLEALIAFIIAGAALTFLLSVGASSTTATRAATRYESAITRARSHLVAATQGGPLVPGQSAGDDGGGFRWRVAIQPSASARPRARGLPVTLYAVEVSIDWDDGGTARSVHLLSEQVGMAAR